MTWKGLVYLLARFPVGLASFVLLVTLLAVSLSLVGIFARLISLHILNGAAWVSGKFARVMRGNFSTQPAAPAREVTAVPEAGQPAPGKPGAA